MRPFIIQSNLFKNFRELTFGFSTKIGLNRDSPYYFNLSYSVGDKEQVVTENRTAFIEELGLQKEGIAYQKQIHSSIVKIVESSSQFEESDAMITEKCNLALAVSAADCVPIFVYDKKK